MTMVPGASSDSAEAAAVASSDRVPRQVEPSAREAAHTMAAGVRALQPRSSRRAAMAARWPRPISTTTVSAPGASESRAGCQAASAWPATTTKPVDIPRCVTGIPARAGAATDELMPGTTSNAMPARALADVEALGLARELQHRRVHERVVEDEVGLGQPRRGLAREQLRISGTRPDEGDEPAHCGVSA